MQSTVVVTPDTYSEVVQLPAVRKSDGSVQMLPPDCNKLESKMLHKMAKMMSGTLIFLKVRATYTQLDEVMCSRYDCYSLAIEGTDNCGSRQHG